MSAAMARARRSAPPPLSGGAHALAGQRITLLEGHHAVELAMEDGRVCASLRVGHGAHARIILLRAAR
ncbi:MAG: hypothetical protein H6924_01990 [Alphaproteobacteria bacterium]|nr:hypothetical protein [Alphaproteobacteria bacterium]